MPKIGDSTFPRGPYLKRLSKGNLSQTEYKVILAVSAVIMLASVALFSTAYLHAPLPWTKGMGWTIAHDLSWVPGCLAYKGAQKSIKNISWRKKNG